MEPAFEHERTLLLVDDEENILRSLTRLLRRDGYTIHTAQSGPQGLALLEEHPVGVIVSDQRMPEMTGSEFLSEVKARWPDTVRIMLSGYTELGSVTDAINRGAVYKFLTKPWDDDLLRENIRDAFAQHELRSENEHLASELRHANEALERALGIHSRALELSRDVLEHLPVGVAGIGEDRLIALANTRLHELLGVPLGGLLGQEPQEAFPPALHPLCAAPDGAHRMTLDSGLVCDVHCRRLEGHESSGSNIMVLVPVADPPPADEH